MTKVLIAGAAGHLGSFMLRECKDRGYWVRALVRDPARLPDDGRADEIFTADLTKIESLHRACDGIDLVFSSVGASVSPRLERPAISFREVDYQGNCNLLTVAKRASVTKFVYVSVFRGPLSEDLEYIKAHEDFVRVLQASGLEHAIIRPTGYFWSWAELLKMAMSGRVFLTGDEQTKENPIHEADLAAVCVAAMAGQERDIAVGGPEIFTRRQMAELAFSVLNTKPRVTTVPIWLANGIARLSRPWDQRFSALAAFVVATTQADLIAPQTGTHTLERYFEETALQLTGRRTELRKEQRR